jgi:aspartate/methionine/tyrosine aminotransferase
MTGWRIGWLVLPEDLVRPCERIGQSLYISAPELSQVAAEAVLGASADLLPVRDGYRRNRDLLAARLPELGFHDLAPIDGAFYAYARVPEGEGASTAFARRILEDCHVAITPGIDFDIRRGEAFVRLSYACDFAALEEAMNRIGAYLRR